MPYWRIWHDVLGMFVTIGEITFMGKSRIMSTGGLLWGLLGLIADYIIGGFGMF